MASRLEPFFARLEEGEAVSSGHDFQDPANEVEFFEFNFGGLPPSLFTEAWEQGCPLEVLIDRRLQYVLNALHVQLEISPAALEVVDDMLIAVPVGSPEKRRQLQNLAAILNNPVTEHSVS